MDNIHYCMQYNLDSFLDNHNRNKRHHMLNIIININIYYKDMRYNYISNHHCTRNTKMNNLYIYFSINLNNIQVKSITSSLTHFRLNKPYNLLNRVYNLIVTNSNQPNRIIDMCQVTVCINY